MTDNEFDKQKAVEYEKKVINDYINDYINDLNKIKEKYPDLSDVAKSLSIYINRDCIPYEFLRSITD